MAGRQHFPPSEEAASAWSAYFSAGGTSRQYLPRLEKARILLRYGLEWKSTAAAQAARSLAKEGDRIHERKPAATRSLFAKIVGRNSLSGALAQAVWARLMFLLRAQSECLLLVRQQPHEKTDEDSALETPAVIGLGRERLVIKLHRRNHVAGRSSMARKCIC